LSTDVDIVIVGGGAAGIGAARRLAGAGMSVRLLEAGSRIGGRAWTHEIAGLELDLGCGWLHSADRNSWVAVANEAGIRIDRSRAGLGSSVSRSSLSTRSASRSLAGLRGLDAAARTHAAGE